MEKSFQHQWLYKNHQEHLIVFLCGWGQDAIPFQSLDSKGTDVLMIYDYTFTDINTFQDELTILLEGYTQRSLIAWSMGVWVGMQLSKELLDIFQHKIAINGTGAPIHDEWGIPVSIFEGTTSHFSVSNRHKFFRRMCGTSFQQFTANAPERSLENQLEELHYFLDKKSSISTSKDVYDIALISDKDLIFPTGNQQAYWEHIGTKTLPIQQSSHFPFYQWKYWEDILTLSTTAHDHPAH
ncbi:pimeloyl-ACP methyl esterase BioG family protein [Algivirga pacifica]|uniref:DUF452 family protein n=1 Tax=Algivirga pacifica TaxID=1162670 RepID=A0ABP9DHE6_9BACT